MVVEYIRYVVPAGRAEEFEGAERAAGMVLRVDEHCLGYEVARGVEESEHYIVRIEWDSIDDEQGFRASPGFPRFLAAAKPFFDQIAEMKHYQALETWAAK